MKKLLVLLVGAALVLSLAAVSMAVEIKGDFRYDMFNEEGRTDDDGSPDETYSKTDLRLRFTQDLSDTVNVTANFKFADGGSGKEGKESKDSLSTSLDEFLVTGKQGWGTWYTGRFEYKFTPSRVELKSGHYHVWEKSDGLVVLNVPVGDSGFSVDAIVQPFAGNAQADGAYGVALNYGAEKWGAKLTYADFLYEKGNTYKLDDTGAPTTEVDKYGYTYGDSNTLLAADVFYKATDNVTLFVAAVDWSANDEKYSTNSGLRNKNGNNYDKNGIDGIDPVIGVKWNNAFGVERLFTSAEYAFNKRFDGTADEYTEYFLKAAYKLNNGVGVELFYNPINDDDAKTQLRLRYQF